MNEREFNYLLSAGKHFAQAAAAIFDAIEACNGMETNKKAKGNAGKFNLSIADHNIKFGNNYFESFLEMVELSHEQLKDVSHENKEFF